MPDVKCGKRLRAENRNQKQKQSKFTREYSPEREQELGCPLKCCTGIRYSLTDLISSPIQRIKIRLQNISVVLVTYLAMSLLHAILGYRRFSDFFRNLQVRLHQKPNQRRHRVNIHITKDLSAVKHFLTSIVMSSFEVVGGILNIAQIIAVILRYVYGYQPMEVILIGSAAKAKRIKSNIRCLEYLHTLDGVQSEILQDAEHELVIILDKLLSTEQKILSKCATNKFLSSPEIIAKLSDVDAFLARQDDNLQIIGVIGTLNVKHRTNNAQIMTLLHDIKSSTGDVSLIEAMFMRFCLAKMITNGVQEIMNGSKMDTSEQKKGYIHLTTGVGMYEGKFVVQDYWGAARELNAALNAGWNQANYYLGMLYKNGLGVERCDITCSTFFQRGTNAGHLASISQLAECYDEGIGVKKSPTKAATLIQRAAESGDPYGMSFYAWTKLNGHYTDVNFPLAYKYAARAVKVGNGLVSLAHCYDQGIQVDRNPLEAIPLYSQSLSDGTAWTSRLALTRCYEQGNGIDVDLERAAVLYEEGSQLLHSQRPYFQGFYGMCLIRGRGVEEDKERGWKEVQKSIQGENATGWYVKGECHRHGYGIEQNLVKAVSCYRRAIQMKNGMNGKVLAKFALGNMYENGQGGLSVDLTAAFEYYTYAAKRMHQESQWKVAVLSESGKGVNQYLDRAVYYFGLAANSGHKESQLKTCHYYMKGKGVSRDLHSAVQILGPAAERGDKKAKHLLRRAKFQILVRRGWTAKTRSAPDEPLI